MSKIKYSIFAAGLIGLAVGSCKQDLDSSNQTPGTFNYETSGTVRVALNGQDFMAGAVFSIYTAAPQEGGKLIATAMLDENGRFESNFRLATAAQSVYLVSNYIGMPGNFPIAISNGVASVDFNRTGAGKNGGSIQGPSAKVAATVYNYFGAYNALGVPSYLIAPDAITPLLLAQINATLPEFINNSALAVLGNSDLVVTQTTEVFFTWVFEGAGFQNSVGFYTYNTGTPPVSVNDIDSVQVIIPNSSFSPQGGLVAGDKISLGVIPAGKSIGWVLFKYGWNSGTQSVAFNNPKVYSNPAFNDEASAANRRHVVNLYHAPQNLILVGFEDQDRDNPGTDNDFNDLLFYITTSVPNGCNTSGFPFVNTQGGTDSDNDGVNDQFDAFPNDPTKAFICYHPFDGGFNSVAFEDLWPAQGDYDFNDLVMDMNYAAYMDVNFDVVEIDVTRYVRHIGASYNNGYGIRWPFPTSDVASVTGSQLLHGIVSVNGNGTEAGQTDAVSMMFDDAFDHENDTVKVNILMSNPYPLTQLQANMCDPFLFVDGNRGREVHLAGKQPTDLANVALFGTGDDATVLPGFTYKNGDNMPWAIEINHNFSVVVEKVRIEDAYLKFEAWAQSNGALFPDWYYNLGAGYRNNANLIP